MSGTAPPPGGPPDLPRMPTLSDAPTVSELMPFRSTKVHFLKSSILTPLVATAVVALILFAAPPNDFWLDVLAAYILFILFVAFHSYSGIHTPVWTYLPAALLMWIVFSPIWSIIYFVFDDILPGAWASSGNLILRFVGFFFVALREEVIKALPALIGLYMFLRRGKPGGAEAQTGFGRFFFTSNALEGLMLGVAAGVGFTYRETMYQYVPTNIHDFTAKYGADAGLLSGLLLLIPRMLSAVTGHIAYGGVSGYFIGLSAKYPKRIPMLVAIGLALASLVHDIWDVSAGLPVVGQIGLALDAALIVVVFLYCLLKAKQLYASERGGVSTDSILVGAGWGKPAAAPAAYAPASAAFAAPPAPAPAPPRVAPTAPVAATAPVAPAPAPPSPARPSPAPVYYLVAGAERCGLVVGQSLDLATAFPQHGLAPGSRVEVSAHPTDPNIVGLRNMTPATWAVEVQNGATASVPPGRNVRLVAGERITIGALALDVRAS